MDNLLEYVWKRLRHSPVGRVAGGALIGMLFGLLAIGEVARTPREIFYTLLGTTLAGATAVWLLERRDRQRNQTREWKEQLIRTAKDIHGEEPGISPAEALASSKEHNEAKFTPIVWVGFVLAGLIALGAIGAFIGFVWKLIRLLR